MVESLSCTSPSIRDISPTLKVNSGPVTLVIYNPSAAALPRPSSSKVSGLNEMFQSGGGRSLASVSQHRFFWLGCKSVLYFSFNLKKIVVFDMWSVFPGFSMLAQISDYAFPTILLLK